MLTSAPALTGSADTTNPANRPAPQGDLPHIPGAARDTFSFSDAISASTPSPDETCIARQPRANESNPTPDSAPTPAPTSTYDARHEPPQSDGNAPTVARQLPDWNDLTEQQVTTLDLLAGGMPVARIAKRLNIHRGTIHRWKTQHPAFIAALNRRRHDALEALSTQCTQLLTEAVAALETGLAHRKRLPPQRVRTALAVLRAFGTRRLLLGPGPTSPEAALRQIAIQSRIEANESLKAPLTDQELRDLRSRLAWDFYEERDKPLPPYDVEPASLPADASQARPLPPTSSSVPKPPEPAAKS